MIALAFLSLGILTAFFVAFAICVALAAVAYLALATAAVLGGLLCVGFLAAGVVRVVGSLRAD